jgi:hypothetical protein
MPYRDERIALQAPRRLPELAHCAGAHVDTPAPTIALVPIVATTGKASGPPGW